MSSELKPNLQFNIVSIFPDFFIPFLNTGVIGKALDKKIAQVDVINPRDYTSDKHQTVDSPPYGGGDGMLMKYELLKQTLLSLKKSGRLGRVYNFSPQGAHWSNQKAQGLAVGSESIHTLICGRYAGIDQRFIESFVDEEISLGDYILSGAELAAQVVIDSSLRFVPGVLGHPDSCIKESFSGGLLEAPQFTQPREADGWEVPEVLLSGHHQKIEEWKRSVSLVKTKILRPDLVKEAKISMQELKEAFIFVSRFSDGELKSIGVSQEQLNVVW